MRLSQCLALGMALACALCLGPMGLRHENRKKRNGTRAKQPWASPQLLALAFSSTPTTSGSQEVGHQALPAGQWWLVGEGRKERASRSSLSASPGWFLQRSQEDEDWNPPGGRPRGEVRREIWKWGNHPPLLLLLEFKESDAIKLQ